jgi:membrane protein
LLETIQDVLPDYTYRTIENTITDIISIQRGGLLSFGFLIALFYATNGTTSLIRSFNALSFVKDSRPGWQTRLLALLLTLIFVVILVFTIIIIIFTHYVLGYLIEKGIIDSSINLDLIKLGEWITLLLMILLSVSSLYFFGPEPKIRPTFFSPGSIVSTFLIVVFLQLFGIFINQFATFNTVYGSVGALIALMVLINLNALILLAGHELNAVVYHLKRQTAD